MPPVLPRRPPLPRARSGLTPGRHVAVHCRGILSYAPDGDGGAGACGDHYAGSATMLGDREFTSEEIAQMCGVSRPAVVEWISRGFFPVRLTEGGHRRVRRRDIAAFLARQGYPLPIEVERERPVLAVIDDEPIWRATLQSMFDATCEVKTWTSPFDALLALGALKPDVAVVDFDFAGMDGRHLLGVIARAPTLAATVRVALCPHEDEVATARRLGAHLALPKARVQEFPAVLTRHLNDVQRRFVAAHEG